MSSPQRQHEPTLRTSCGNIFSRRTVRPSTVSNLRLKPRCALRAISYVYYLVCRLSLRSHAFPNLPFRFWYGGIPHGRHFIRPRSDRCFRWNTTFLPPSRHSLPKCSERARRAISSSCGKSSHTAHRLDLFRWLKREFNAAIHRDLIAFDANYTDDSSTSCCRYPSCAYCNSSVVHSVTSSSPWSPSHRDVLSHALDRRARTRGACCVSRAAASISRD